MRRSSTVSPMPAKSWRCGVTTTTTSGRIPRWPTKPRQKRAGRFSYLRAPHPARLPHPNLTNIKPADSSYERGTTGRQVIPYDCQNPSGAHFGAPQRSSPKPHLPCGRTESPKGRNHGSDAKLTANISRASLQISGAVVAAATAIAGTYTMDANCRPTKVPGRPSRRAARDQIAARHFWPKPSELPVSLRVGRRALLSRQTYDRGARGLTPTCFGPKLFKLTKQVY